MDGAEVAVKLAGSGAKNMAILLYAILSDQKKTAGKARLATMIKSGKELKVYTLRDKDLSTFVAEAKKYGILFSAVKDPKDLNDGTTDIIVRAEDAARINHLVERCHLATTDTVAKLISEIETQIEEKPEAVMDEKETEQMLDELFGEPELNGERQSEVDNTVAELFGDEPKQQEGAVLMGLLDEPNPTTAETEKSPPSEHFLHQSKNIGSDGRPSVRAELADIAAEKGKGKEIAESMGMDAISDISKGGDGQLVPDLPKTDIGIKEKGR